MKRVDLSILVVLLALRGAGPAAAFVLQTDDVGGALLHPRWPAASLPIPFEVSDSRLELLANPAGTSAPLAAIQAALQSWSIAPVGLYLDGTTRVRDMNEDSINLITFADTAANRDFVGSMWGSANVWWNHSGDQAYITEADIVLNPKGQFATAGANNVRDLQDEVTQQLGWALGLDRSAVCAAAMFPHNAAGQTYRRSLEPDDVAGLHALYGGAGSDVGAIAGQVLTVDGAPVFGAHVVATDTNGIVRVGVLTDWDGSFILPSLPANSYEIYAQPLDGPLTPDYLLATYRDAQTDFRTVFAGGNRTHAAIPVVAGETTSLDPIRVDAEPATLSPQWIAWSPDGSSFSNGIPQALQIASGETHYLVIGGQGLPAVPRTGFSISGSDVSVDASNAVRGVSDRGNPYIILQVSVRSGAAPGARSLIVTSPNEQAAMTGALKVTAP